MTLSALSLGKCGILGHCSSKPFAARLGLAQIVETADDRGISATGTFNFGCLRAFRLLGGGGGGGEIMISWGALRIERT